MSIEYLKAFNLKPSEYDEVQNCLTDEQKLNFAVMRVQVSEILSFMLEFSISNIKGIIIYRPDLCFKPKKVIEESFKKLNQEMLISIIDANIDDLICFDI